MNLKQQLCNYLIEKSLVKENDVIRHSYSTSRMKEWNKRNVETNNIVPTLDTRCDCLGVVVKTKNDKPKVIGGIGEKKVIMANNGINKIEFMIIKLLCQLLLLLIHII